LLALSVGSLFTPGIDSIPVSHILDRSQGHLDNWVENRLLFRPRGHWPILTPCIARTFSFTSVKNNLANAARCEEADAHPDDLGLGQG
jgi:hypothetical protein